MAKLFANSGDPDPTPRSAASDLGLHCLPSTLLRVSRLQWVNPQWLEISMSRTNFHNGPKNVWAIEVRLQYN